MFRTNKAHPWHGIEIGPDSPEEVTVFVEDPGAFTTPWKAVQRWRRVEDAPILTVPCNENNGDFFNQGLVPLAEAKAPDF